MCVAKRTVFSSRVATSTCPQRHQAPMTSAERVPTPALLWCVILVGASPAAARTLSATPRAGAPADDVRLTAVVAGTGRPRTAVRDLTTPTTTPESRTSPESVPRYRPTLVMTAGHTPTPGTTDSEQTAITTAGDKHFIESIMTARTSASRVTHAQEVASPGNSTVLYYELGGRTIVDLPETVLANEDDSTVWPITPSTLRDDVFPKSLPAVSSTPAVDVHRDGVTRAATASDSGTEAVDENVAGVVTDEISESVLEDDGGLAMEAAELTTLEPNWYSATVPVTVTNMMYLDSALRSNEHEYLQQRDPKVLNFFPVPVSEECVSNDNRRIGTCLNTYECRILEGESHGPCALGFGVCCVFAVSCEREVSNNVTYFLSPKFPELTRDAEACSIQVKKMAPEISQLRLDFVHFNLGQPNRRTGVCDSDVMVVSGGSGKDLRICGQNSGQHVYYDVENVNDSISITVNLTKPDVLRLWEVKVTQVEFNQRAPAGCLQYYQGTAGVLQTLNFAENGRHLADQDYLICMRQEENMCSIVYEPCDENSFRIGPGPQTAYDGSGNGASDELRDCVDKIVMPCDSEDFIMPKDSGGSSVCDLMHCGSSFCTADESPCTVESSTLPFNIRVQFGPGDREESPDDNLGMCLRYKQLPCSA